MTSKKVLMMVYGFVPDDPRVITEARTATKSGYQVDAIGIGFPSGYSGDYSRDNIQISIVPIINSVSHIPKGIVQLIRGKLPQQRDAFPVPPRSNIISLMFFYLWILRLTLFKRYDLVHAHEHQTMPIGWLLATLKRLPWVYDAHEHVPENRAYFNTFKSRMAIRTESFFIRRANTVITVGSRLASDLETRGVKQVVIIGNWKPLEKYAATTEVVEAKRLAYQLKRFELIVSFFGVLNEERQVNIMIDAIKQTPQVGLLIAGKGDLRDMVIAASQESPNIIWLDWLPYDQVPLHILLSDVIYGCLQSDEGNARYMAPNKLFDAFAAGKAMIATRDIGEIGQILADEEAAILLDEVTPQTVQAAFIRLIEDQTLLEQLQSNARAASQKYNWGVAEERLNALYSKLIEA